MYNFYPSILDEFQRYLESPKIYQKFWGVSENPSKTEEEFEQECFQSLINKINRVPFESEAADKGTAYNELIDSIINKSNSDKINISRNKIDNTTIGFNVQYKDKTHFFQYDTCIEIAEYLKYGISQELVEGVIDTDRGQVRLYGYLDYRLPDRVIDIKTTSSTYNSFKFRDNTQHLVYTYCLCQQGIELTDFEYLIVHFGKSEETIFRELYNFNKDRDEAKLRALCSHFIDFIETYKHLITDEKIFGLKNEANKTLINRNTSLVAPILRN
jgi:hypothetical protein